MKFAAPLTMSCLLLVACAAKPERKAQQVFSEMAASEQALAEPSAPEFTSSLSPEGIFTSLDMGFSVQLPSEQWWYTSAASIMNGPEDDVHFYDENSCDPTGQCIAVFEVQTDESDWTELHPDVYFAQLQAEKREPLRLRSMIPDADVIFAKNDGGGESWPYAYYVFFPAANKHFWVGTHDWKIEQILPTFTLLP